MEAGSCSTTQLSIYQHPEEISCEEASTRQDHAE